MKNILSWTTFNENSDYQILPIEISDKIEVLNICAESLKHVDNPERIKQYLGRATEWDISKKCVFNGKIIGAYLLNHFPVYKMLEDCERLFSEKKIPYFSSENYQKYRNLRGIHGLALVVDPAYQKTGAGKKLRDVPLTMGYDYIWGYAFRDS